jgi:tetratricopeptide (TPR) repeat protein
MSRANILSNAAPNPSSVITELWNLASGKKFARPEADGIALRAHDGLSRRTVSLLFVAMLLAYVAIAACSIHAIFFPLDDMEEIYLVRSSRSWLSLLGTDLYHFFRPIKNLMFVVFNWLYCNEGMVGARSLAVAIGLFSAWAVYKLCCRLLANRGLALVATSIWLLSPTLVSCTAWLSASNILLMTGLAAVALTCHDLACEARAAVECNPGVAGSRGRAIGLWSALASLCLFLALATYEGAVAVVALFPVVDWYLRPARLRSSFTWRLYVLYGLVLVAYMVLRHQAQGTQNVLGGFSGVSRLKAIISSGYLTTLHASAWLWPFDRMAVIGGYYWGQASTVELAACSMLVLAALVFSIIWRRRYPYVALGVLWFLLAFAPMSNVLGFRNGPYCDSYMALASIGAGIALAAILRGLRPLKMTGIARVGALAFITLLIALRVAAALEAASWSYAWNDPVVAYERTVHTFPQAFDAMTELAKLYEARAEHRKADELSEKSIALAPDRSGPYAVRAVVAEQEGRIQDALKWLGMYRSFGVSSSWGLRFEAEIYADHLGQPKQAEALFRQAVAERPWRPDAIRAGYELAYLLVEQGKRAEAISLWEEALIYLPQDNVLHWNLAKAYAEQGNRDRASYHIRFAQNLAQQVAMQSPDHKNPQ